MLISKVTYSDISIKITGPLNTIEISGIITDKDAEQFQKFVSQFGSPSEIKLNSSGGSVDAAISIGRQIRQSESIPTTQVTVRYGDKCVSSCIFILAGGQLRFVGGGLVGIHRPFLPEDPNLSIQDQKIFYRQVEIKVKEYLEEVNVPTSLYDAMFRIPVDKIYYLTEQEMQQYNLNEHDPYYEEALHAGAAANLNMSKLEYLEYKNQVRQECSTYLNPNDPDSMKKYDDCKAKVMKSFKSR